MTELPEITEAKRLTLRPGDALVVRTGRTPTQYESATIKDRLQATLRRDVPVLVIGPDIDIEVASFSDEITPELAASIDRALESRARQMGRRVR